MSSKFTTHRSPSTTQRAAGFTPALGCARGRGWRKDERRGKRGGSRGLGMVEAAVSTVIVGVMLVAALNAAGAARTGARKVGERARASLLAQQLMSEVLQCAYEDPIAGSASLGPDASESTGNRSLFDDVDDCTGWSESPPQNNDGSVIPDLEGWARHVAVEFVNPADPASVLFSNSGAKRITVTVTYQGRTSAVWTAVRCSQGVPQAGKVVSVVIN